MPQYKQALVDGLWRQNPGLVQFLGICPLLAVSNSAVNGIALGAATLVVLVLSNSLISMLRPLIPRDIRLPVFVLVIASLVTLIERAFEHLQAGRGTPVTALLSDAEIQILDPGGSQS